MKRNRDFNRLYMILKLRWEDKMKFKDIGLKYGITGSRVVQLFNYGKRFIRMRLTKDGTKL